MAIYKNLIVGCSLGAGTLLILISTQLSNTIISIQNGTNTQEPPHIRAQNPIPGISIPSEQNHKNIPENSQLTPTNHPPIVYNQTIDTEQLTSKNFTLKGVDPDNEQLVYVKVSGPFHGDLRIINSTVDKVMYTPNADYNGFDKFTFKASDGKVNSINTGTVSINVKPLPPDKELPYKFNFTYGKDSSPLPASSNIPYMVHFMPNGKNINILKVNKGSFNNYNITGKDTVIFNTGKLVKGENKSAIVVLGSNENLQNLKPKINVSAIIDGKPVSGIIQPPNPAAPLVGIDPSLGIASLGASIGTVLDLPKKATGNILGTANEVIGTVEKGYHLFHTIYNDSFSCFRLQLTIVSTQDYLSPNYNVEMKNCANHPEHIILQVIGLPNRVTPSLDKPEFDMGPGEFERKLLTLHIPPDIIGLHTFVVRGNVTLVGNFVVASSSDSNSFFINASMSKTADGITNKGNRGSRSGNENQNNVPRNNPPVAINSAIVSTFQDKPVNITLAGKDPDNDSLSFIFVKKPSLGNIDKIIHINKTLSNITYTPIPHSYGQDIFTFRANDGNLNSTNIASAEINVKPSNSLVISKVPPTISLNIYPNVTIKASQTSAPNTSSEQSYITTLENSLSKINSLAHDNGSYRNQILVADLTNPLNGKAMIDSNGSIEYRPNQNFVGRDVFYYTINYVNGHSKTTKVIVDVMRINHPPTAYNESITTDQYTSKNFTLKGYDPDNEKLRYIKVSGPLHGDLHIIDPNLGKAIYTPDANYNGSDSFTFKANDGKTNSSGIGKVSINIKPFPYTRGIPYKFKFVYGNESSSSHPRFLQSVNNLPYKVHFDFQGKNASILKVNKGTFSDYNITGKDTVVFNTGKLLWGQNKSAIIVLASNNNSKQDLKPVIHVGTIVNQTPISDTIRPTSPIAMPTVVPSVGIPSFGPAIESVESILDLPKKGLGLVKEGIGVAEKIYNFSHAAYIDFVPCFSLQLSHTLTTDNLKPTYNVKTQNCSNHPEHIILRIIGLPKEVKHYFGSSVFDVEQHQTKDNTLTMDIPASTTGRHDFVVIGDVIIKELGNFVVTNSNASDYFFVKANMPPIADAGKDKIVNEGATVILDGTKSHDQDNGTITSYLWKQISGIPVVLSESHTPKSTIVEPHVPRNTNLIFELMVKDDRNATSTSIVNVYVKHINHPPIAKNQTILLNEDTPSHIALTATDYDVGDVFNYSILVKPVHGILSGKAPNLVYKPNFNYNGKDSFMFKVDDGYSIGNTSSNIGKVNLTINQVNDPPVAINGSVTSTYQGKPVNITLTGRDPDDDKLSFLLVKKPIMGNISKIIPLNKTSAKVIYVPYTKSSTNDSLAFKVNDGKLDSKDATIVITIKPLIQPPTNNKLHHNVTLNLSNVTLNLFNITMRPKPVNNSPIRESLSDIILEAANRSGTIIHYDTIANVTCTPPSGSVFPIGNTKVSCTAKDSHGNTNSTSFEVIVQDKTPPMIFVPPTKTVNTTSPSGASVTFTVKAGDNVDGSTRVTCTPPSGSVFPIGNTKVSCTAKDSHGNISPRASFQVKVLKDKVRPTIKVPLKPIVVNATSVRGNIVHYNVSATDNVSILKPKDINCMPSSGSIFSIGNTSVSCIVRDQSNNTATKSFIVIVQDKVRPTIKVPLKPIVVNATSPSGANVTFEVTASDNIDGRTPVTCTPPSGSVFPIGNTTISCTAKDKSGNSSMASFQVIVNDNSRTLLPYLFQIF